MSGEIQQFSYGYAPTLQMSNFQTDIIGLNSQLQGQTYGNMQMEAFNPNNYTLATQYQGQAYENGQIEQVNEINYAYGGQLQTQVYGNQQYEYVQQAISVPEVQLVQMPVQEIQMMQVPVQEVQMVPVQVPIQEIQMVPVMQEVQTVHVQYMTPPPLKYERPAEVERAPPTRSPSPVRERAEPPPPPPREQRIEYVDHEVLIEVPVPKVKRKNAALTRWHARAPYIGKRHILATAPPARPAPPMRAGSR